MRLVADESVEFFIVAALRTAGHEVYFIAEEDHGIADEEVLRLAFERGEVLLTEDKDFGELVFSHDRPHRGVVLLRMHGMRPRDKTARIVMLFSVHGHEFSNAITTVRPRAIRIRPRA
jgi:predicted nuclease of predicted toxin-antitoxin system